jgi:predicted transposase YbfD/YdcC
VLLGTKVRLVTPKKVGTLPVKGSEEAKKTNEIGMFVPLLEQIDITNKDITADALLTQRNLASYLVDRGAHYHFTAKGNQPTLQEDIAVTFEKRGAPDYVEVTPPDHGRIETRRIWTSTLVNDYLNFPHVGQVFLIEREVLNKKSGKSTLEIAHGLTSRTPEQADAKRVLEVNRKHWAIENSCHYVIDWNYNEDRNRIRTGHGPENITRLRRFAITVIARVANKKDSVSEIMRRLQRNPRLVLDYLRMTKNSAAAFAH